MGLIAACKRWSRRVALWIAVAVAVWFTACTLWLVALRWFDPPATAVQVQRRIESWFADGAYHKRYEPLPLAEISEHLPRAAIAAEDTRFYEHGGIDWKAIEEALDDNRDRARRRGGSTISQQLTKNLLLTTHSTWMRKVAEVPLTYLTELILPKERILELYLNVAEWGPDGIFGAEAAARHHYGVSASALTREQAARLAACLPAPRRRSPHRMDRYSEIVLRRMESQGF